MMYFINFPQGVLPVLCFSFFSSLDIWKASTNCQSSPCVPFIWAIWSLYEKGGTYVSQTSSKNTTWSHNEKFILLEVRGPPFLRHPFRPPISPLFRHPSPFFGPISPTLANLLANLGGIQGTSKEIETAKKAYGSLITPRHCRCVCMFVFLHS